MVPSPSVEVHPTSARPIRQSFLLEVLDDIAIMTGKGIGRPPFRMEGTLSTSKFIVPGMNPTDPSPTRKLPPVV